MNTYITFIRKEIMETLRNKRLFVLACVFASFALLGPLMGRYMVEFINMFIPAGEMDFLFPEPTWADGYANFYMNIGQIGVIAIILLYMGVILDEKRRGTAPMMLMKGLTHTTFVMSKFTVMALTSLVVMMVSTLVAHFYTYILFDGAGRFGDAMLGGLVFWVLLLFFLVSSIFFSTIAKKPSTSAVFGLLSWFALVIFDVVQRVRDFLPFGLVGRAVEVSTGYFSRHLLANILITLGVSAVLLVASIHILKKKEL
ncbi:MAG: ABC transporter permease subunit [Defluviitaleaceae bacterium]|nr:ABC transporter permease subunit [Defluviitaleaceae bacterium]